MTSKEADSRKSYILRIASHLVSLNLVEEKLPNVSALHRFCDTEEQRLVVTRLDSKGHVDVRNEVSPNQSFLFRVIFYKQQATPLTSEYKREVSVLTANQDQASDAFLGTIKQVYGDIIQQAGTYTNGHIPSQSNGIVSPSGFSLQQELKHWTTSDPGGYNEILEPLAEKFAQLNQMSLDECEEFVEVAEFVLDGLWNSQTPYGQSRMKKMIDAVSFQLYETIRSKIPIEGFWASTAALDQVHTARALCDQWILAVKLLTTQTWALHTTEWRGEPANMNLIEGYKKRLEEIEVVRRLCNQVSILLNDQDGRRISSAVEQQMAGVNFLVYDSHKNEEISSKLRKAEAVLDGFVDSVLPALRTKLSESSTSKGNPVADIHKYREILARPRESLFMRVVEHFRQKRRQYEDRQHDVPLENRYLTEIGSKVVWVRSNLVQFQQINEVSQNLFTDLASYPQFDRDLKTFVQELQAYETEQFDLWCKEMLHEIDDSSNSIALETTGRLMKLDKEKGTLSVSYSDRLVGLLREVSQLSSLGFTVPRKITQCTRTAEQFYRYGNVLKQVAHFYNSIEQQMLPCQQAMMIEEALRFEKLLMPKGSNDINVRWDEPKKLQEYIEQLQEAALNLTNQNRLLRKAHSDICMKILRLVNMDMIKDIDKWSSQIAEIRQRFAEEERRVSNPANMRPWAIYLDRQLQKIVQLQFQCGIESLQSTSPTVQVQLILRDQNLQLRPNLHELKAKYYEDMQKFFALPSTLKSIQRFNNTTQSPFSSIPLANADRFSRIYAESEKYFIELSAIEKRYIEWLWLSRLNLEDLVAENFQQASDWERQLTSLKAYNRKADDLPNETVIGPISLSLVAFKNSLTTMLRRMNDTLTWTLRHSVNTGLHSMSNTIKKGMETLTAKPQSMQEVGETNKQYVVLKKDLPKMIDQNFKLNEQNSLLRRLTGNGVADLNELNNDLERYKQMLEMFDEIIKEQVDAMKESMGDRIKQVEMDAERLHAHWSQFRPSAQSLVDEDPDSLRKTVEFIREHQQKFETLKEQYESLQHDCEQFDLADVNIHVFEQLRSDIESTQENFKIYEEFDTDLRKLGEMEWILFRNKAYLFDEFLADWATKLKSQEKMTPIVLKLQKILDSMNELSPALKYCRGDALGPQHWAELFRLIGLPRGTQLETLTFNDLLGVRAKIVSQIEELKNLSSKAQGEAAIIESLQELELWAAQAEFQLTEYKHSNGQTIKIIREWKEPMYQIKDNQTLLMSLKNLQHYAQFKDQTSVWEKRIADLDIYLQQMNQIQRRWVYLEPIFGRGALPAERARFQRADTEFRSILYEVGRDPRLTTLANQKSLARQLEEIADQLSRCQRALNDFLEIKRVAFPRFYFLGDDDMLEILGQSTNPSIIQNHLKKLFQGIDRVIFDSDQRQIRGVISPEGEQVSLLKSVQIVPEVETYLKNLVEEIRATLKKLLLDCLAESSLDPGRYPTQIVCLAEEVRFTRDVEQFLNAGTPLNDFKSQLEQQLSQFTQLKIDDELMSAKVKSLVLDIIHHIEIVDGLLKADGKLSTNSWAWQKQIRFYVQGNEVKIRHATAEFAYTYEYQGCAAKLVHTALTDKCYLTLTQALSLGFGGNPFGPAGTGKTESVKALANLMGRQVLVFNCDEGIDVQAIGRMFIGLIQCGAWGCFDEFNRLDKDVLSTVSSQVQTIQDAIRARAPTCELNQRRVNVDTNAAIFITLNPVGKGYGGRQKMPDNLKQLFRPVVMSKPNNLEIAETLLFAEGFKHAKRMARKIITIFEMSRDLLSNQQHYDWGLRSMKTVLKSCGSALAVSKAESVEDEDSLVVHSLMLSTLSKLTFSDFHHFNSLLDDVFPGARKRIEQFEEMLTTAKQLASDRHLQLNEAQLTKIMELNEQLNRRMGVVVVGPPGAGKSTLWQILKLVLEKQGTSVDLHTMNPKSMPKTKFLGEMNLDTREWTDGVLTSVAREVVKDTSKRAWIVCDGDVDPDWIEALNSVLDDNKLLTMPTGERIQFGSNVNFIFETDSLAHASPATISRMGMIYISDEIVDVTAQIYRLVKSKHVEEKPAAEWLQQQLPQAIEWHSEIKDPDLVTSKVALIENVFSFTWNAETLDEFRVGLFRGLLPYTPADSQQKLAQELLYRDMNAPDPSNLLNVYFDSNSRSIQSFSDDVSTNTNLASMRYEETRPTILTGRMKVARDTVSKWLEDSNRQSFCVIGHDGAGKDYLLKASFSDHFKSALVRLNCGARTSTMDVIQLLLRSCVQVSSASGRRALRPKEKDFLIVYLKSIDLIQTDRYGSSMTIAFLESLLNYSGFYDSNNDWNTLENVQIVCTFAYPSSSGRAPIPLRFFSRTRCMYMEPPSENELVVICSAYIMPILNDYLHSEARVESYAASLVQVYRRLKEQFAAATQTHYSFSTRDLIAWILALMRYQFTESNVHSMLGQVSAFEARRIFRDRLISIEHCQLFDNILADTFGSSDAGQVFAPIQGAFLWNSAAAIMGKPMEQTERQAYQAQLAKNVKRYEFEVANFPYVLSDELVDLCIAMDRALTQSGGSILIAGPSDTSQRGVANMVANMHSFKTFSPRVSSTYTLKQFCQDLKQAMTAVTLESEPAMFLLEDYQLLNDAFLQYVNQLLATGSIPGLFTQQEFEQMSGQLRDLASQDAYDGELVAYFANKVKQNLHVVILLDTEHPRFGERLQTNPSLYKFCTVLWRTAPSRDLLTQSARIYLEGVQINVDPALLDIFCEFYATSPQQVRTPQKYSTFLQNFAKIYRQKQQTVEERLKRLRAGVDKLKDTREQVSKMEKKAAKKSKLLAEKQEDADKALAQITKSMTGAKEQRFSMEQLRVETEKESQVIEEQKRLIEEQLKEVEPMLQEARKAVGSIKSESLSEIRSLRAPPEAIRDILQAVLLFMGILDNSWEAMRRFLAKNGVKDEIINFDARKVSPDVHKRVQALVKSKSNSFDEKVAKRASVAAAPLAAWVMANLEYTAILEKIQPLEKEKNNLLRKFQQTDTEMKNLSSQLSNVDKHVEELRRDFESSMKSAAQIKIDLDRENAAIQVAGTMVDRLGSEFERWQQQMQILQAEMSHLDRNCALAAASISYLGVEAYDKRQHLSQEWNQICPTEHFDVVSFLALEADQQRWRTSGLPNTKMASENACILFNTIETPLIIDSTGGIADFLTRFHKQQYPQQECQLLKSTQADFLTQIELGVRFGKTLIVDDLYNVEPAMVQLLRKEFSSQGPRQVCQIGDKQIDVNEQFKLYLCTRNEQIRLQGHIKAAVTEVNFSTTLAGLSSQILSLALNIERPELEDQSVKLASEAEKLNLQLTEIEQVLLNQLATSEGSLLENTQLLDSLNQSKESADLAEKSLAQLEKIRKEIDEQKQIYMPFSERCSLLYFAFNDMHRNNHMYNFNVGLILDLFKQVFVAGSDSSTKQQDPSAKLQQTYTQLVHSTFYHVSGAIFKQDRLAFGLRFVRVVQSKMFQEKEWQYFVGHSHPDNDQDDSNVQVPSWIAQPNQASVGRLRVALPSLYNQLGLEDRGTWNEFASGTDQSLPSVIESKLSPFQRVLAIQALRPDRLNTALNKFVCSALGIPSINPPSSNLGDMLQSTRANQPIFLVLGTSADPSQELADLAQKSRVEFHLLAMGNSQQQAATQLLRKCMETGSWLCLSNLHLVPDFLLTIHGLLSAQEPKAGFRLWLTAEPDDSLPAVPLQQSMKVAYETPPGIKQNLLRTLAQWIELEQNNAQTSEYLQRAYFILAWFHALVQERRTYIPQGWLKFYEFNTNDIRVARQTLENQTQNSETNWEAVRGFYEDAIYGGRIEQQLDIGILRAYLHEYMTSKMMSDSSGGELRPGLRLPRFTRLADCVQFVKNSISDSDSPSAFGLPENLLATWEIAQSQRTVSMLQAAERQNPQRGAGDFVFSEWSTQLTPILTFWKKLNQTSDLLQAHVAELRQSTDPLLEMLSTELHFAVALLKRIHASLTLVRKGLSGKLSPNAKTIQLAKSLAKHETPTEWDLQWPGPQQCFDYMELACAKAKQVKTMASLSDTAPLFAASLNLDDFFRPTALFNALRQFAGRKLQTNVDDLQFATSLNRLTDSNIPQLQLGHLKIQGAALSSQGLSTIASNAPVFSAAPAIYIAWIPVTAQPPYSPSQSVELPLFVADDRDDYIAQIRLPCSPGEQNHWITASVALFTRVN